MNLISFILFSVYVILRISQSDVPSAPITSDYRLSTTPLIGWGEIGSMQWTTLYKLIMFISFLVCLYIFPSIILHT